jgi:hypothetical protein
MSKKQKIHNQISARTASPRQRGQRGVGTGYKPAPAEFFALFVAVLFFLPAGCITLYDAAVPGELNHILVVEGFITDDTTVITLTRTVNMTIGAINPVYVDGATLYVECSDGSLSAASESLGNGRYTIRTGVLSPDVQYRLQILLDDGEQYMSSFLTPLSTPDFELGWEKGLGKDSHNIHIVVSTRGDKDALRYYMWSYRENWETTVEMYADSFLWEGVMYNSPEDYYYCWRKDSSRALILHTSENLTDNVVSGKNLVTIVRDAQRLTVLYHIAVQQNLLRKESFLYFSNLQKNVERTATVFTPIPSEIKGNIMCITNPEKPVIGFVEVSATIRRGMFISREEAYDESIAIPWICTPQSTDPVASPWIYAKAYFPPIRPNEAHEIKTIRLQCLDCTKNLGSKEKPDFWPNDHK